VIATLFLTLLSAPASGPAPVAIGPLAPGPVASAALVPPVVQKRGGRGGGGRPTFGGRSPGALGPGRGGAGPPGLPKAIKRSLPVALPRPSLDAPGTAAGAAPALTTIFFPEADLPEQLALQKRYFQIADYDANGWISYREATASLGLDRGEFPSFDADRDGRIVPEEFDQRFQATIEVVGSFRPPTPASSTTAAAANPASGLIGAADLDGDGLLAMNELDSLLSGVGITGIPAGAVMAKFDTDQSGSLDSAELEEVAAQLSQGGLAAAPDPASDPRNIDDLFGVPAQRVEDTSGTPLPPRLVGPVTHFRRLDFDNDGVITPDDLLRLQAPIQVDVRARAIIAFLDANGDGQLDRTEFDAAMD